VRASDRSNRSVNRAESLEYGVKTGHLEGFVHHAVAADEFQVAIASSEAMMQADQHAEPVAGNVLQPRAVHHDVPEPPVDLMLGLVDEALDIAPGQFLFKAENGEIVPAGLFFQKHDEYTVSCFDPKWKRVLRDFG